MRYAPCSISARYGAVALASAPFIQEGIDFCRAQGAIFGALFEGGGGAAHFGGAEVQAEGGGALADGVATGEAGTEINLAFQAEVCRVEDFVGAGVVKNGPRVDARAVCERAARRDRRVEWDGQVQALGYIPIEAGQVAKIIACQQVGMVDVELRDDAAQRGDAVALTDAQHGDIQAVRARLQRGDGVGDGAAGIVVAVKFDTHAWIAFGAQAHQPFHLARRGNAHRVRQTDTLRARLHSRIENGQQIDKVAAKGVLGGETHVASGRAHTADERNGGGANLLDPAPVTVGAQFGRGAVEQVEAGDGQVQRRLYIGLHAAHVRHNRGAQAQTAQRAHKRGCGRRDDGRRHLDSAYAKGVQQAHNFQPLLQTEEGALELLALAQRRIENGQRSGKAHNTLPLSAGGVGATASSRNARSSTSMACRYSLSTMCSCGVWSRRESPGP